MSETKKYDFDFSKNPAKEYWSVRVFIDLKDRLYDIADELRWDIGEVLNECLASGLKHQNEWAKKTEKNYEK